MSIKDLIKKYQTILTYMAAAFTGSVLNFITAYLLYIVGDFEIVKANSVGLVVGFLWTFIASKVVFHKEYSVKGFIVYLGTFFLAMFLANLVIKYASMFFGQFLSKRLSFMIAKVLSGALPFITNYVIRKLFFKSNFV